MSVKFSHDGELQHYFRHAEFGPPSAQLEILGGSRSTEPSEPRWPPGAIHSIMVRVFERLALAEGYPLMGKALPKASAFQGNYQRFDIVREMYCFSWGNHLARLEQRVDEARPGAWITLWAYYGPLGKGRRYAEGNDHDNTKDGPQECEDPEVALWPLVGGAKRECRGEDLALLWDPSATPEAKRSRDRGRVEGVREALDRVRRDVKGENRRHLNEKAKALLFRARGAYSEAAKLQDRLFIAEVTSGL